jgi:betaine reductase
MDLQSQEAIKRLAEQHDHSRLLVILGSPDAEAAELAAETVVLGDPAYAGPLTEAQLGLEVYHVLEEAIREQIPDDVFDAQIGVMADVLDATALGDAVSAVRARRTELR